MRGSNEHSQCQIRFAQASNITAYLHKTQAFTKAQLSEANELLTRALLHQNVPPCLLQSEEFKAYSQYISSGAHKPRTLKIKG